MSKLTVFCLYLSHNLILTKIVVLWGKAQITTCRLLPLQDYCKVAAH